MPFNAIAIAISNVCLVLLQDDIMFNQGRQEGGGLVRGPKILVKCLVMGATVRRAGGHNA